MRPFSTIRRAVGDLLLLLTNPTTVFAALFLIFELIAAACLSFVVPVIVHKLALPSSVEAVVPLDLLFETCVDQLYGVCSFPTATIDLKEKPLFSSSVHYGVSVAIRFADVDQTKKLGLFNNILRVTDKNGKVLKEYHKSAYLKEPSFLRKAAGWVFYPLYLLGYFYDPGSLDLLMAHDFYESYSTPSDKLLFQLQHRFAQVESAELRVIARFGMIRHILYWWPWTSYLVIFLSTFYSLSTVILVTWGYKGVTSSGKALSSAGSTAGDAVGRLEDVDFEPTTPPPTRSSTVSSFVHIQTPPLTPPSGRRVKRRQSPAEDEFIPENVHEVPECVLIADFERQLGDANSNTQEDKTEQGIDASIDNDSGTDSDKITPDETVNPLVAPSLRKRK